jgi:hypothetical protein
MEPATFRFVALCLNQLRHQQRAPYIYKYSTDCASFWEIKYDWFHKTCAIPSLPDSHTEVPQPTDTVLMPCLTLPEFQAVSSLSRVRARAMHIVGTAASSYELFLRVYC